MSTPLDELKPKATGPAGPGQGGAALPTSPTVTPEDAQSQALADALRSSFAIVKIIMVLLVVVFFASGIFTVPSQERAIILRFGRPVGAGEEQLLMPGLHWSFPYPIDEVVRIPISQIQTVTSTTGWYALAPGEREEDNENAQAMTASLNPASDGYVLTGDGNIIHVKVVLRYRINDPLRYTLNFVNAAGLLQNSLDNALIHASAEFNVDQALKSAQFEFKERIVARVRQLIDEQGLGITILNAEVHPIPPRQVRQAFNDVLTADLNRRRLINDAQGYASSNLLAAVGESNVIVNTSQTVRDQLVQMVRADAKYFTNQLPHYRADPQLFLARLQTEAIQRTLTNAQYKVLRMDDGARPMRVQVSREPEKPPPAPER
jgi:membrane protease subunit HflK